MTGEPGTKITAEPTLRGRNFLPLFLAQFSGAVNDNLFKNALVVLLLFGGASGSPALVALAGGVFILPYVLFSSLAGGLADRFDKSRLIRLIKCLEILLMALGLLGLLLDSTLILFIILFGLGVQATFFGPLKYAILPELLREADLLRANSWIEAGTFIGILLGTIAGSVLVALPNGRLIVGLAGMAIAALGTLAGCYVPSLPPAAPALRLGWNLVGDTTALLAQARRQTPVWRSIVALSWFWTIGAAFLAEFPVIVKTILAGDSQIVTVLLAMFSIGIGAGSMLCSRLLRGDISARHVPYAALLLSICGVDFAFVCTGLGPQSGWHTVHDLLVTPAAWRLLLDLFLVAVCGGLFSVPLYAIIQERAPPDSRARMIGANNIVNAAFIVVGAVLIAVLSASLSAPVILMAFCAANLAFFVFRRRLMPT